MTDAAFDALIEPRSAPANATTSPRDRRRRRARLDWLFGDADTQAGIRGTAWAGYQAVAEYVDHYGRPHPNKTPAHATRARPTHQTDTHNPRAGHNHKPPTRPADPAPAGPASQTSPPHHNPPLAIARPAPTDTCAHTHARARGRARGFWPCFCRPPLNSLGPPRPVRSISPSSQSTVTFSITRLHHAQASSTNYLAPSKPEDPRRRRRSSLRPGPAAPIPPSTTAHLDQRRVRRRRPSSSNNSPGVAADLSSSRPLAIRLVALVVRQGGRDRRPSSPPARSTAIALAWPPLQLLQSHTPGWWALQSKSDPPPTKAGLRRRLAHGLDLRTGQPDLAPICDTFGTRAAQESAPDRTPTPRAAADPGLGVARPAGRTVSKEVGQVALPWAPSPTARASRCSPTWPLVSARARGHAAADRQGSAAGSRRAVGERRPARPAAGRPATTGDGRVSREPMLVLPSSPPPL